MEDRSGSVAMSGVHAPVPWAGGFEVGRRAGSVEFGVVVGEQTAAEAAVLLVGVHSE